MNAILVIDKPPHQSSHDVVQAVRRLTGEKRVGHAGTLDPMATGVLVVCLGHAVRLVEYLTEHDKKYRATVRLGIETNTYDATGKVVAHREVRVTPDEIRRALATFIGRLRQIPPAFSAVQRDGVRAYKLARKGIPLELAPRTVEIYAIERVEIRDAWVEFDVYCSKGVYIRSLAHDLGQKLGTGAHLAALRRLASGPFTLEQSVTLQALQDAVRQGDWTKYLLPMDHAVAHLDAVHLDSHAARRVVNGQFIAAPPNLTTRLVRAYDENGNLIAILERNAPNLLKPKKVLKG